MLRKVSQRWSESLAGGGFLGSFEVDFSVNRTRISGLAANAYGLLQKTGLQGADHAACCRAMHPDDFDRLKELRLRYAAGGGRWVFRSRMQNRFREGGSYAWIEAHYTVELDTVGTPVFARGIVLDIDPLVQGGLISAVPDHQPFAISRSSADAPGHPRGLRVIDGTGCSDLRQSSGPNRRL